jgi:hypothetical protein
LLVRLLKLQAEGEADLSGSSAAAAPAAAARAEVCVSASEGVGVVARPPVAAAALEGRVCVDDWRVREVWDDEEREEVDRWCGWV